MNSINTFSIGLRVNMNIILVKIRVSINIMYFYKTVNHNWFTLCITNVATSTTTSAYYAVTQMILTILKNHDVYIATYT